MTNQGPIRPVITRPLARPPMVRKPNKIDVMISSVILFLQKIVVQLGKTLLATTLAAAADVIRRKGDPETNSLLNKHGGSQTDNQRNLYGGYPPATTSTTPQGNYPGYYGSGYDQRKSYGHESFPGFGS